MGFERMEGSGRKMLELPGKVRASRCLGSREDPDLCHLPPLSVRFTKQAGSINLMLGKCVSLGCKLMCQEEWIV